MMQDFAEGTARRVSADDESATVRTRNNIETILPPSPIQQSLLFHSFGPREQDPGFLHVRCRLRGDFDVSVFEDAWNVVVERHAALRMSVQQSDDRRPLLIVWKRVKLSIDFSDLSMSATGQQRERIDEYRRADRTHGLDLADPPVMRVACFRTGLRQHEVIWSCHHALLDGWSASTVMREVVLAYRELSRGVQPVVRHGTASLRDYYQWLKQQSPDAGESYWRSELAGFTSPTSLALPQARQESSAAEAANCLVALDNRLSDALQRLAAKYQVPTAAIIQAAWALLLSRRSGQSDVVFGLTVSGRPAEIPAVESMVGCFTNALPVRARIDPQTSLSDWCRTFHARQSQASPYEHVSLVEIQRSSEVPLRQRLFESLLVIENIPWTDLEDEGQLELVDYDSGITSAYPLTLIVTPTESWIIRCQFDARRFAESDVSKLLDELRAQLLAMTADPGAALCNLISRQPSEPLLERVPAALSSRKPRTEPAAPPRSPLEAQVLGIWQQVLGIPDIGIRDTFRNVGGYSLLAVVIVSEIEKMLSLRLSVTALSLEATVESVCRILGKQSPRVSHAPVQEENGPLLFLPAGTGDTLFFFSGQELLRPESIRQEMRATRLEVNYTSETKLETIAARYAAEMRSAQPRGPYLLAGQYCGTAMTLEVARQLMAEGEQIAFLGFVDAMPPVLATSVTSRYLRDALRHLRRGDWRLLAGRGMTAARYRFRRLFTRRLRAPITRARVQPFRYREALGDYLPAPYPGKITLFISTSYKAHPEGRDCIELWSKIAEGGLDYSIIPAEMHPNLFQEPHLSQLLEKLPLQTVADGEGVA